MLSQHYVQWRVTCRVEKYVIFYESCNRLSLSLSLNSFRVEDTLGQTPTPFFSVDSKILRFFSGHVNYLQILTMMSIQFFPVFVDFHSLSLTPRIQLFLVVFTARRVCTARTMPWQDVRRSVRLSVSPSVRHTPVFYLNGYKYPLSFFHHLVAPPF